ncbi:hypothetical protein EAH68_09245 [Corynebacterium hylobatis]|uniref:Uncharacterized protein n=1 Tax=Corynebacterium hylobatis TaxID=1859290 RepID=A0A430HXW2_9CORY|nr:DUF6308 family protein [Corynebacterium hylobatis]RSZ62744.1 hypothetical protein EAH68_09245 [Corynebacterium hylobatis]
MRIPEIITHRSDTAVRHLRTYYSDRLELQEGEKPVLYTGAYFDRWPGDGPDPSPDEFTAEDLIAVGYLSVPIHPSAALEILRTRAKRFSQLLATIPTDADLVDIPDGVIHEEWPAWRLERGLRELKGIGAVRASKLIARKRPRLYPIYDSVVTSELNTNGKILEPLHRELRSEDSLGESLRYLREEAGLPGTISDIRIFDVITWMEGKQKTGPAEDRESALRDEEEQ